MNKIKIYKKEISKKYKKLDNEKLIQLYNENKIDELVNSLLPLVIYLSNKYYNIDFDELVCIGNEGLLKGIKNFDISKCNNIIHTCRLYINYSILDYLRQENNLIKLPQIHKRTPEYILDNYPKAYITDNIANFDCEDEDYVEPKISRKEIEDLLMTIPKMKYSKVQVFLDYIFIEGITYRVIAEKNGYTHQNVSLIIKDMIDKIKKDKVILQQIGDMLKIN
jgi:RNA polymerase sigma factor (sigma-70 family)